MANTDLNLVLITIDCGRQDHICGDKAETPCIDDLRGEGIAFTNAFSQASTTFPSFFSLFSSQYVSTHGLTHQDPSFYKNVDDDFLPVILGKNGWDLGLFSGFDLLQEVLMRDIGNCVSGSGSLPVLDELLEGTDDKPGLLGRLIHPQSPFLPNRVKAAWNKAINRRSKISAEKIAEKAVEWIAKRNGKRFFLWVHFFDSHEFYTAPRRWIKKYYEKPKSSKHGNAFLEASERGLWFPRHFEEYLKNLKDIEYLPASYRASLSYIDEQVGRLITQLKESGEYEKSLLILTADHGENLMENGMLCGHYKLFDQTTKIPLILKDPDLRASSESSCLVQHIDVMPTVLERLGISPPKNMQGKSLRPCVVDSQEINEFTFAEHDRLCQKTVRTRKWQYVWADPAIAHPHGIEFEGNLLLDRTGPADRENHAPRHPLLCQEFESLIRSLSHERTEPQEDKALNEKWKQRLMALGYL